MARKNKHTEVEKVDYKTIKQGFLVFTVLCTGAGILMLEVLGARIAGPFFGVSLYIWTALISVTLVSLSVGYWLGGRLCDRHPRPDILYGLILVSGLMIMLIAGLDEAVLGFSYHAFSGVWRLRLGVLLGSLILFGPPLTLLGMVSPFALKMAIVDLHNAGRTAGRLYAISTIGSVLGSIITGYFLIPSLGIEKTLFVITGLILLPSIIWFAGARRILLLSVAGVILAGAFFLPAARLGAKDDPRVDLLLKSDGLYGQIKVMDLRKEEVTQRFLLLEGAYQTSIFLETNQQGTKYIALMEYFLKLYPSGGKRLLLLGLGGGCIVKPLVDAGFEVDAVEIDPVVVDIADKYFGLDTASCRIITDDCRAYIRTTDQQYDVILFDVFGGGSMPFHLFSREAFSEVHSILNPGGIVGINIVTHPTGKTSLFNTSVFKTVHSLFSEGRAYWVETTESSEDLNNMLMFFSDRPFHDPDPSDLSGEKAICWERLSPRRWAMDPNQGMLITDNHNPVDRWTIAVNEDWRQKIYDSFESGIFSF